MKSFEFPTDKKLGAYIVTELAQIMKRLDKIESKVDDAYNAACEARDKIK